MKSFKVFTLIMVFLIITGLMGCQFNNRLASENNAENTATGTAAKTTAKTTAKTNTVSSSNNASSSTSALQTMDIGVYYLKSSENEIYQVREVHRVEKTTAVARSALNELINGKPLTPGAFKVLPSDTKILGINIDQGVATVDFSSEVLKVNVGSEGEALGIASIVNTLTEFPTIQKVQFTVEGKVENGIDWWGHVGLYEQPFKRDLNSVYEPSIWVTEPVENQIVTSPLKIKGSARVFEATVSYRLKDENGNILAQGFTTATAGAPERGSFSADLAFSSPAKGKGQLEVFEESMKDGGDLHKVVIPVIFNK